MREVELHLLVELPDDMRIPDLSAHLKMMVQALVENYPRYQNSLEEINADDYYQRLSNEVLE